MGGSCWVASRPPADPEKLGVKLNLTRDRGEGVVSWVWSRESTLCRLSFLPSPLMAVAAISSCSSCLARCRILTAPRTARKAMFVSEKFPHLAAYPAHLPGPCPVCRLTPCLDRTRLGRCCVNRSPLLPFFLSQKYIPGASAYVTQSVYIVKVTPAVRERSKTTHVTCQRLSKALPPKLGFRHQGYDTFLPALFPETAYEFASIYPNSPQANLEGRTDIKMYIYRKDLQRWMKLQPQTFCRFFFCSEWYLKYYKS